MLAFDWPWVFLLLPLPLAIYFFTRPYQREQSAVIVPFYYALAEKNQRSLFNNDTVNIKAVILFTFIWILLVSAAARPYWSGEAIALPQSGRDLLLAVDISESMDTADMVINDLPATRLQAVKQVVQDFIERRKGDRLGLVLFGSRAYLQSPLTFDSLTVAQFLDEAQLGFAGPKTAIGDAIGLSAKRLLELDNNQNDKILILLTDGANTAGEVDPLQAARLAQQADIKIYTIGIGADKMTVRGFFGPQIVNPSAQLDEKTLSEIANLTQGQYFRAKETQELEKIYQILDELEPIEQDNEWLKPKRSLYMWPLAFALILSILVAISRMPLAHLGLNKANNAITTAGKQVKENSRG